MSWGYGKNWTLLDSSKLTKTFENSEMKVYTARIIYMGYLNITYINTERKKTVILKYDNHSGKNYDVSDCKSKEEVIKRITGQLLEEYHKEQYIIIGA